MFDRHTKEKGTARLTPVFDGHTHGGTYTRRDIHTGEDTHEGDIRTEIYPHGRTYTRWDIHTEGHTH